MQNQISRLYTMSHNSIKYRHVHLGWLCCVAVLLLGGSCDVVGVDEAQFFDEGLTEVCVKLANSGVRVIAAGLDMDYLGKPFGPMPALMAVAEYVTKVHAVCVQCGDIATYSYRSVPSEQQVLLGETDSYEARCRHCFTKGMKNRS